MLTLITANRKKVIPIFLAMRTTMRTTKITTKMNQWKKRRATNN